MEKHSVAIFEGDDHAYLTWLNHHADGFVINTPRSRDVNYMVLHCATCFSISTYTRMARPGGFTERQYIKICGTTIESLRAWVRTHGRQDGSFSSECQNCRPDLRNLEGAAQHAHPAGAA
jgi:hypothetical protein